jgi:hypothetical protein
LRKIIKLYKKKFATIKKIYESWYMFVGSLGGKYPICTIFEINVKKTMYKIWKFAKAWQHGCFKIAILVKWLASTIGYIKHLLQQLKRLDVKGNPINVGWSHNWWCMCSRYEYKSPWRHGPCIHHPRLFFIDTCEIQCYIYSRFIENKRVVKTKPIWNINSIDILLRKINNFIWFGVINSFMHNFNDVICLII